MEVNKQNISLSERIEEVFRAKKIKQIDLVNKYDYLSSALINKFFNNQKTITEILIKLCMDEDINIDWLCTGRGNMFITNEIFVNTNNTSKLLVEKESSFQEHLTEDIKKLSPKRQEYYYHRIKADLIEEELR
jgi:spore germination protein YaaH